MDNHIKEFFTQCHDDAPKGTFHKVIPLSKEGKPQWDEVVKLVPNMPRGWYELSHIPVSDRIEFTRDFWLSKLPYHAKLDDFLNRFFASLDDIAVFITQQKFDDPFDAQLVYSLKGNKGFFRGSLPAADDAIIKLQSAFPDIIFPEDYIAFLKIHDGFAKTTDCTGIIPSTSMKENYDRLQSMLLQEKSITTNKGTPVDPSQLIPFYESFGMPFFQCFWADWYPENEMGNVYYSGVSRTISDTEGKVSSGESMSFPSFTDWLMFYMELIA